MLPEEDRYYLTRSELLERVATLLAGRVAEEVILMKLAPEPRTTSSGPRPCQANDHGIRYERNTWSDYAGAET